MILDMTSCSRSHSLCGLSELGGAEEIFVDEIKFSWVLYICGKCEHFHIPLVVCLSDIFDAEEFFVKSMRCKHESRID